MMNIKNLSREELFDLLLQVDPKEIDIVCQSKNLKVREICASDEFKKVYYRSPVDISDVNNEELREITKDKIILIFSGCYCPPHAGHYNMVKNVIKLVKPDIVMIQSTNHETRPRHGVPLEHTIETWKNWGKILSKRYGVDIYISSMFEHNIWIAASPETKMVIQTEIYENVEMPEEYINNPLQKDKTDYSLSYFEYVPRDRFYKYHVKRTGNFSATKFVECLKDLNKDCLEYVPSDVKDKNNYIDNIRKKYGKELK
jgi:hypothetical protein